VTLDDTTAARASRALVTGMLNRDLTEVQAALLLLMPGPDVAPTAHDMAKLQAVMLRHLTVTTRELARLVDVDPREIIDRLAEVDEAEYGPPDTL
jgi:hypothetical protein